MVDIFSGPTFVFETISALPSMRLVKGFAEWPGEFDALIWASFDSGGAWVVLEGVSVIVDINVVTEESPESSIPNT